MQAVINDPHCILDYIVLVGPHMPLVQFVTYHVQRVKSLPLQQIAKLSITPLEPDVWNGKERHACSLACVDGSYKMFDVTECENGKFVAGTSWEWRPNDQRKA